MGDERLSDDAPRRWLVAAAHASLRIPGVLAAGSRTLLNGLWLGLLSEADLAALDERFYAGAAMYTTAAWNERGLFDWERQLVEKHFDGRSRVVVTSCGGGREVLALLHMGFDAVGYESHPDLATFGRDFLAERGFPDRVRMSPRDAFPPDSGACDAVVVGWGAYSLIHDPARRRAFLDEARRAVRGDGPILLSYLQRASDDRELRWTAAVASRLRRLRGKTPPEIGDTLAPNQVHLFSHAQLVDELCAAGLTLASYWTTGQADQTTSYGCAVAVPA